MLIKKNAKYYSRRADKLDVSEVEIHRTSIRSDSAYLTFEGENLQPRLITVEVKLILNGKVNRRAISRVTTKIMRRSELKEAYQRITKIATEEANEFLSSLEAN